VITDVGVQSVLSVLVKNFVLETRDGHETKIEMARGFFPRPKVAGEAPGERG
jgi:hypothetical protein